ncbi:MAG: hypothetical protein EOP32_36855 [Rhodococcus sp. (in: high G+C Gram-positive bacteria)]|nr:MAG: hypothetical protein EOP32_36855 [Rhodococcus sp. (in: high G+C Gram-positive bacteria)]
MLALYEVVLDLDGEILSYRRTRRYRRGSAIGVADEEPSIDEEPPSDEEPHRDRRTVPGDSCR